MTRRERSLGVKREAPIRSRPSSSKPYRTTSRAASAIRSPSWEFVARENLSAMQFGFSLVASGTRPTEPMHCPVSPSPQLHSVAAFSKTLNTCGAEPNARRTSRSVSRRGHSAAVSAKSAGTDPGWSLREVSTHLRSVTSSTTRTPSARSRRTATPAPGTRVPENVPS